MIRCLLLALALVFAAAPAPLRLLTGEAGTAVAQAKGPSGLPLPRFVSLKSEKINVRRGPGQNYDIAFIFVRAGLPVEIIQEFDNWRKIRDSEGSEGWIFHSLLSGERMAIVAPWEKQGTFASHASASEAARIVAYLEPKVIVDVTGCDGKWCGIAVGGIEGSIPQERLWGVYPGETFSD